MALFSYASVSCAAVNIKVVEQVQKLATLSDWCDEDSSETV